MVYNIEVKEYHVNKIVIAFKKKDVKIEIR